MFGKIFSCEETGAISKTDYADYYGELMPSQFCVVYRYDILYKKELERLNKPQHSPYALPAENKPMRIYNGIDREPSKNTPENFNLYSERDARVYFENLLKNECELIFIRLCDCECDVPKNMSFLGYDVAYVFDSKFGDGFSAICDCMFLARWHGCDESGKEFEREFNSLNRNGLFDRKEDAVNYLVHYLNQEWSERGDFCIYEIYR